MKRLSGLFLLLFLVTLQACHVPLRPYRLAQPTLQIPPRVADASARPLKDPAPQKSCVDPATPICLAFIEIDDMGELFDVNELHSALAVIRRANDFAAEQPDHADPIVLVFVHGWKNNASHGNPNVEGFKAALQEVYDRFHKTNHVIGIYIGWRGNLINPSWPVAQQLSYYNREATATRVPGATLSSALAQIAERTHKRPRGIAVFIGHSFGGLLLERAVSEATADQIAKSEILQQRAQLSPPSSAQARTETNLAHASASARADLIVFINPAGAATESMQMLDFLLQNGYRYQPQTDPGAPPAPPGSPSEVTADRPLFVSLTSTADLPTKFALPVGHSWPYLKFKMAGSFRPLGNPEDGGYSLSCFDPHTPHPYRRLSTKEAGGVAQGAFYISSAPHMPVLQSHLMLKAISATQMQAASTGQKITVRNPRAIADCDAALFRNENLKVVSTFRLWDTQTCFAIEERPNRCNGSPYWLMELDPDVVPDHNTIFTERFINFLIDTFFSSSNAQPMKRSSPLLFKSPCPNCPASE